ncbi:nicotinamide N-methyltransferase-like [Spea bombifrons]|uniref:nicotinamide N-methyltransferase-like n=1 Tax=Spea bombifrons TaxID=233779 RepID=UPI00234ABD8E|nr:nicotinamide N-methyltransferase-like [Spea bombifrons]
MSSTDLKYYHEHDFESKHFLDAFFSPKADECIIKDGVENSMNCLQKELITGHIHGDMLIDISAGPNISHLMPICKFFKEITVLEFNDLCITELKKWLNSHEEAYDWSHASNRMLNLEERSGGKQAIEELLKSKIKRVLKCDLSKDSLTDPIVLPKADCIISAWAMEAINKDKNDYIINFRKISSLLKPGGRLILFGSFNVSYYILAGHKYGSLTYDEEFLRKVLKDEEYITEVFQVKDRETPTDYVDYEKTVFVIALKQREG